MDATTRPAALRTLPGASRAFITASHDTSTTSAATAPASTSSPGVSSVERTTPRSHLSQWALRREAEQQHGIHEPITSGPPARTQASTARPLTVSKLLHNTSTTTAASTTSTSNDARGDDIQHNDGEEASRRRSARRVDGSGPERPVQAAMYLSTMGLSPSGVDGDTREMSSEMDSVLGARRAAVEAVGAAVPRAHLSLVAALESSNASSEGHPVLQTEDAIAQHMSPQDAEEEDEEDEEETRDAVVSSSDLSESDVAGRVLTTLQEKDTLIASLSAALRVAESEALSLRQERAYWREHAQQLEEELAIKARTIEVRMTPPPPPPPAVDDRAAQGGISPGAHAAIASRLTEAEANAAQLQQQLEKSDAALRRTRDELTEAQQSWELQQVTARAAQEQIRALEQRCQQLRQQLVDSQGDKREDVATLRAHITQLQNQLDDRTHDLKEKERTHKRELAGLHKEMEALNDQFEAQLTAIKTASALQEKMTQAQHEVQQLRDEVVRINHDWHLKMKALEAQGQAHKRDADSQAREKIAVMHERDALQEAVKSAEHELTCTRKDLSELREAHACAHEEISALRMALQRQSTASAENALASARHAQREADHQQRLNALEAALKEAREQAQQREQDMDQLRDALAQQVETLLADEAAKQADVAEQIRGCTLSAEKMEEAVVTADERRRLAEDALRCAQEEVQRAHAKADRLAVQCQNDVLEHQELATAMTAFHREKLNEALAALTVSEKKREETESRLAETQNEVHRVTTALAAAKQALADSQRTGAEREKACAELTEELVETKTQLKAALKAQLAQARATNKATRRCAACVQQLEAYKAQTRTTQRDQHAIWTLIGNLAALLDTSLATSPERVRLSKEARTPRMTTTTTAPAGRGGRDGKQRTQQRMITKDAQSDVCASSLIPLDELVQRTQALRWWNLAQQQQQQQQDEAAEGHRQSNSGSAADADETCWSEAMSSSASSSACTSRSASSSLVGHVSEPDDTTIGEAQHATPRAREGTKSPASSASSVVVVMSATSHERARQTQTKKKKEKKAARKNLKKTSSRVVPGHSAPPQIATLPMPPLTDALRSLLHALEKLRDEQLLLRRGVETSRTAAETLQNEKRQLEQRCVHLERQFAQEKSEAEDALRSASYRAQVDLNKAIAAVDVRWQREMEARVKDVIRHNEEANLSAEAAEKRVRFDRCQRVAEELVDFIARIPECLSAYQQRNAKEEEEKQAQVDRRALMVAAKEGQGMASLSPQSPTPQRQRAMCPPEGEQLEPPGAELRTLCDDISRGLLGLDGGWQDLADLCAIQRAPTMTAITPSSTQMAMSGDRQGAHELTLASGRTREMNMAATAPTKESYINTSTNKRAMTEEWGWSQSMLLDVEDALLDYLTARLHCAPPEVERHSAVTRRANFREHQKEAHGEVPPPPQSQANAIREWVRSLRAVDEGMSKRSTDAQRGAATVASSSDLLLSNMLSTCLAYAVDNIMV